MAYGQPEVITAGRWADEVGWSPHREQFFGLAREKLSFFVQETYRQLKPAFYGWYLAKRIIDAVDAFQYEPFTYVMLSRSLTQMGLAPRGSHDQIPFRYSKPIRPLPVPQEYLRLVPYVLACRDVNLKVSTDQLVTKYGLDDMSKSVIVFDSAEISSAAFIQRLIEFKGPVFTPATIGFYGVDDEEKRKGKVLELTGLKVLAYESKDELNVKVVEDFGFFKQGNYKFHYGQRIVTIRSEDLPADAKIIAQFPDGNIALYKFDNRYISAFNLDIKDYELVAPLTFMLTRTIAKDSETFLSVKSKKPDSRLYIYPMGSLTAVVNADIDDKVTNLQTPAGTVTLPVRAKDTACYKIKDGKLVFAIVTAKGTLSIKGKAFITCPDGVTAIYDNGSLEVRPYYSYSGNQILAIKANGKPLKRVDDELTPCFQGKVTLPLKIELSETPRADIKIDLVQSEIIANGVGEEFGQEVKVLAKPDIFRFICRVSDDRTKKVRIMAHKFISSKGKAAWEMIGEWIQDLEKKYSILEVDMETGCLETIRVDAVPLDQEKNPVKGSIELSLEMLYKNRVMPSMSYVEGDFVVIRILYPYRYEKCRITGTNAKVLSHGKWESVEARTSYYWLPGVIMSANGQHYNHLYRSEFKVNVLP
jgi:hypothetical protein